MISVPVLVVRVCMVVVMIALESLVVAHIAIVQVPVVSCSPESNWAVEVEVVGVGGSLHSSSGIP